MNVTMDKLTPGVMGVSHGGGVAGEIIRSATGSWAGHAFLYLGNGVLVQGHPARASTAPADCYPDAIWGWRMWNQLVADFGWTANEVTVAQDKVAVRGRQEIGTPYDFDAYLGFTLEVLHLRNEQELAPEFRHDSYRVCSALVADAETFGGVPLDFIPEDGPGIIGKPGKQVAMPPNLVAPGMLLGLMQRLEWA